MDITGVLGFINGVCFMFFATEAYSFFMRKENKRFNTIIGCIFSFWSLLLLKDPLYQIEPFSSSEYYYKLLLMTESPAVVSCAFYVMELLNPCCLNWKRGLMHMAPYILLFVSFFILPYNIVYEITMYYSLLYGGFIIVYLYFGTKKYNRLIKLYYSDTDKVDIKWLWRSVSLLAVALVLWFFVAYPGTDSGDIVYYFSIMLIWGIIAYKSKRQELINDDVRSSAAEIETFSSNDTDIESVKVYGFEKELDDLFEIKEIARNPQLTMPEVVRMVGTNRSYFSSYLNSVLKVNFYDYVNGYRLLYAEKILVSENLDMSQEEIAQTVGFNSISTYRRAFMKKHNMTPLQYRKIYMKKTD